MKTVFTRSITFQSFDDVVLQEVVDEIGEEAVGVYEGVYYMSQGEEPARSVNDDYFIDAEADEYIACAGVSDLVRSAKADHLFTDEDRQFIDLWIHDAFSDREIVDRIFRRKAGGEKSMLEVLGGTFHYHYLTAIKARREAIRQGLIESTFKEEGVSA